MSTEKPSPVIRLMPSLTDLAFLLPVVFHLRTDRGINRLLGDGDTGWHLRTGEWILANGAVPSVDIFSYTRSGEPWFAWEWGCDLAFGWLHREFGCGSLLVAGGKLIVLSDEGELVVAPATPDEFKPIAQAEVVEGRCWTVPVLSHGLLYVRTSAGKLVCLDVRK